MKRAFLFLLAMAWLLTACNNWLLAPPEEKPVTPTVVSGTPTPYFYEVKQGDSLWSIAKKMGVDVNTLVVVNELEKPDEIHPGDRLLISNKVTVSGRVLPTPTPTPIPCLHGCIQPPKGCVIKGYQARLDGMKLYVTPDDEIYPVQQADVWFCREQDARNAGWRRWTPRGPEGGEK